MSVLHPRTIKDARHLTQPPLSSDMLPACSDAPQCAQSSSPGSLFYDLNKSTDMSSAASSTWGEESSTFSTIAESKDGERV